MPDKTTVSGTAPAKLNLWLRVINKRPDGYHNLQTLMAKTPDLCDHITVTTATQNSNESMSVNLRLSGQTNNQLLPARTEDNLIVRAVNAFLSLHSIRATVTVDLHKRIPIGSGLAGGSSDAATTLKLLNKLYKTDMNTLQLQALAVRIGADCPFFFSNNCAVVAGIGEKIIPVHMPVQWHALVCPPIPISTAQAFSDLALPEPSASSEHLQDSEQTDHKSFQSGYAESHGNDFLETVLAGSSQLQDLYQKMSNLAQVKLTGTGSCLFFSNTSRAEILSISAKLMKICEYPIYIVRTGSVINGV